jgi:hypothetical protein
MVDLTSALYGMPQMWPSLVIRPIVFGYSALSLAGSINVDTSTTLPSAAYARIGVGCASMARSGGVPPWIRVLSTVSWLEPMLSTWILMPVAVAKSASAAAKLVPSPPIHCVWIETVLPL